VVERDYMLGEAPEGWVLLHDIRYYYLGVFLIGLHFFGIIVVGALGTSDPSSFFTAPIIGSLVVAGFILFVAILLVREIKSNGEDAKYGRYFHVEKTKNIGDKLQGGLPKSFYPVKRRSDMHSPWKGTSDTHVTLTPSARGRVRTAIEIEVRHNEGLVTVEVRTSDKSSSVTQELLDGILAFFDRRKLDWPSVDFEKDPARLAKNVGRGEATEMWYSTYSRDNQELYFIAVLGVELFFLLMTVIGLAIGPTEDIQVIVAIGILLHPLVVLGLLMISTNLLLHNRLDIAFEHFHSFPASPWFVTAAVEEMLQAEEIRYETKNRFDHRSRVPAESFLLTGEDDVRVSIDISVEDRREEHQKTGVRIRSSGEYEGITALKRNVFDAVYNREISRFSLLTQEP
jgi:hypothetical protein